MATPKWFDANAYMQNKLAQLKAQEPDLAGPWTGCMTPSAMPVSWVWKVSTSTS